MTDATATIKEALMLFSSQFNKLAHFIQKSHQDMTWRDAFHTAVDFFNVSESDEHVTHPHSIFGTWKPNNVRALAGHFWALKCLYREAGDLGRSLAFGRVSQSLFVAWDEGYTVTYQDFINQSGVGSSVIQEIADYYRCAITGDEYFTDHTDRIMHLLYVTNNQHSRVNLPRWTL
jgi:hypothetical protein